MVLNSGQIWEHRRQAPISPRAFVGRMLEQGRLAVAIIALSVLFGVMGYHWLAGFGWIDAFLNASMILGGMGPVGELKTNAAKIFAALYALYAGLVFLVVGGVLLTPVLHRVLHRFHWESDQAANEK
ncbi:MAG: hypothetical protein ABJF01_16625 [bacterium]